MSAWSNLSNADHIDWVIESVKTHPELWNAAWRATRDAAWRAAREATRGAILALIAYDKCDQYLNMTSEQLQVWALLSERPAAMLLLPMIIVREQIEQMESV